MLEKIFKLQAHGTTVRTEVLAGITTFLTMAYIIFVNPNVLAKTGMDHGAVFVATCIAAAIASFSHNSNCSIGSAKHCASDNSCLL